MFDIRKLTEADYETLLPWWKWFRFPAPPQDCLPENGAGGLMVSIGDTNICAGFLYFTNSKLCWVEFIVSNPEYRLHDRGLAIQILIKELCAIAKGKGYSAVFSSIKHPSLIKHYVACGFNKNEGAVEMIKLL